MKSITKGFYQLIGIILCFSIAPLARGLLVEDLYETTLEAQQRGEKYREELFSNALLQVLVKVSGDSKIEENEQILSSLKEANTFVQQYAYLGDNLKAKFSPKLVNNLLSSAQLAVWGNNRPLIILWLAISTENERHLVGSETDPAIPTLIETLAKDRGLPLVLPLLDLQDVSAVTVTDVWGEFPSVLQEASVRYASDGILVGRLSRGKDSKGSIFWETKWRLLIEGENYTWSSQAKSVNDALKLGINGVVKQLSSLYGIVSNSPYQRSLLVGIQDIQSVSDYAKALEYLKSLAPVEHVEVESVAANLAVFKVFPLGGGGRNALAQAIDLDQNLVTLVSKQEQMDNVDLAYRWVP